MIELLITHIEGNNQHMETPSQSCPTFNSLIDQHIYLNL